MNSVLQLIRILHRSSQAVLHGKKYRQHANRGLGDRVASQELPGFEVDVTTVFAVEESLPDDLQSPAKKPVKRKGSNK
jgi:hypothetical protein